MSNVKYNLTLWQRIQLPFVWIAWVLTPNKRPWHLVKKGAEKHKCNFIIPENLGGVNFLKCDHEGCINYDTYPKL